MITFIVLLLSLSLQEVLPRHHHVVTMTLEGRSSDVSLLAIVSGREERQPIDPAAYSISVEGSAEFDSWAFENGLPRLRHYAVFECVKRLRLLGRDLGEERTSCPARICEHDLIWVDAEAEFAPHREDSTSTSTGPVYSRLLQDALLSRVRAGAANTSDDEWDVPLAYLADLLAPGGTMQAGMETLERHVRPKQELVIVPAVSVLPIGSFLGNPEGEIKAKRVPDGIELTIEVTSDTALSDALADYILERSSVAEAYAYAHSAKATLSGRASIMQPKQSDPLTYLLDATLTIKESGSLVGETSRLKQGMPSRLEFAITWGLELKVEQTVTIE